ncbi:DUF1796 family putative cysteine peptidase [Sphingomonas crusticola]|uniref:DUF1796 family putative cysteine peptidase n=1 Tax=Sphingomonas crusticola TaxID=1697973 RepID=UPI000E2505C1|nr:DUF1796 family putative cysteine peptidase [Sphingomonas crusticola]
MNEDQARALATELYRGILKREPDAGGLDAYTQALAADGSPERIARLMQEFSQSAEAQTIAARLRGITVADRPSPIGPIEHIISLGTDCYASFLLKLTGWKRASYPFDWLLSSPPMVVEMLRDDFAGFLDPAQHRSIPMHLRRTPHERCADHLDYRARFGIDAIFMHRDVAEPVHRAYYERAVARFRAVTTSEQAKLLFMTNIAGKHATHDDFDALCELVAQRYRNAKLLVVNVERAPDDNVARIGGSLERQIGVHELIRYRATSPLNGMTFTNWIDDINLRGMIGQYHMRLAD